MENKKIRVAINGFGRIGRSFLKLVMENEKIDVVAVNDLADIENVAYLLKYDSVYGVSDLDIKSSENSLILNGKNITYLSEKEPKNLPWKDLGIDIVLESTGVFNDYEKSQAHIDAGSKRVVITAPVKDSVESSAPDYSKKGHTILVGLNEDVLKTCKLSSNASCTTNAGSPILEIMKNSIGVEKAMINSIHGYTASQSLVDSSNKKDFRRGRAGAQNIVPSSTGAAISTTQVIEDLKGSFDGIATRVPVISGSILDLTFVSKRETSVEEINQILIDASKEENWNGVFSVTEENLVSTDILGNTNASIADLNFTRVVGGNLVKILSWFDNEMGYTNTLVRHVISAGNNL